MRAWTFGVAVGAVSIACIGDGGHQFDAGSDMDGGTDAPFDGACDAPAHNRQGCPCQGQGTISCNQGLPGPKSACDMKGTQSCTNGVYGPCVGGGAPSVEVCYDDIDNDCNGQVDEVNGGCPCSAYANLCDMRDPSVRTLFTVPAMPKANQPFDIFVITRDANLRQPLAMALGGSCSPGGVTAPCPSPGAKCMGWIVVRFNVTKPAGSYSVEFYENEQMGPCNATFLAPVTEKEITVFQ